MNALTTDNGFILPKPADSGGMTILRVGFLGNVLTGAVAAAVSWGLYGPVKDAIIIGTRPPDQGDLSALSVSTLFTAVLIGIGGARWLTNEVDKKLLRAAAAEAAGANRDETAAAAIASAPPASALEIATKLPKRG